MVQSLTAERSIVSGSNLVTQLRNNVQAARQLAAGAKNGGGYQFVGGSLSVLAGELQTIHSQLIQNLESSGYSAEQARRYVYLLESNVASGTASQPYWESEGFRAAEMGSETTSEVSSTASVTERSPFHRLCQDEAYAFTYANGKSGAVIVADGISSGVEEYSREAAQIVVDAFHAVFDNKTVDHVLTEQEARQLSLEAYKLAAGAITHMIDKAREQVYRGSLSADQKAQLLAKIARSGTTLNFQTLCRDSRTGRPAIFTANMGDSVGAVIDMDTALDGYRGRGTRRVRLLEESYIATTRRDQNTETGYITRSVNAAQRIEFETYGMGLTVLPEGVHDIILLSRSDALDKIHVFHERWIMEKFLQAVRANRRSKKIPLAKRFVDGLLVGVKDEWRKPVAIGQVRPFDDVSFAALQLHFQ